MTTPSFEDRSVNNLFDVPERWRADVIAEFRLRGAELRSSVAALLVELRRVLVPG